MTLVLGVDGCRNGWCCVAIHLSDRHCDVSPPVVFERLREVLAVGAELICIDIPIGLLDRPGQRACDVEARRMLGRGRASSVFPPTSRRALSFVDYRGASNANFQLTGRYLTRQSFNISPLVRQVDAVMKPGMQQRVREVHPELCFWALNGRSPLPWNKKSAHGRHERWLSLRRVLPHLQVEPMLPPKLRGGCGLDDYLDALVAAWTSVCILRKQADCIPKPPEPPDDRGLRMEIWLPAS